MEIEAKVIDFRAGLTENSGQVEQRGNAADPTSTEVPVSVLPVQDPTPSQIVAGVYERRETVEAFQFTEAVASAVLLDKATLPWGLSVSGSYHQVRREVHYASVWVPSQNYGEIGCHAHYGDWICRVLGRLIPIDNESFCARYRSVSDEAVR